MKLAMNHKKNTGNIQKLGRKYMLLNNDDIKVEITRYLETNENENTTVQSLWHTEKAVLNGKFITLQGSLSKKQKQKQNRTILK